MLYVDCASTLYCLHWQGVFAKKLTVLRHTSGLNFGLNLREKTCRHAKPLPMQLGLASTRSSTYWERCANAHAYRFAKLGTADHRLSKQHIDDLCGLVQVVKEAGRWAGEQEAWLQQCGLLDAVPLADLASAPAKRDEEATRARVNAHSDKPHVLKAADFYVSGCPVFMLACIRCAAYA